MRVLVTGVSGFVGRRLAPLLRDAGHQVAGTWIGAPPEVVEGVELHPLDLADPAEVSAVIAAVRPERIVHLAGFSHVGSSWSRMGEAFRVNVLGTENVMAAAGEATVVVASSAEVYGPVPAAEQPIAEDRPLDPGSPYALTKAAAERLALARGAVVARPFNLVGPGQASHFALPAFASQLAAIRAGEQEPVLRVGNLEARRDFLHVDDGAEALLRLVEAGSPATTYQIASGEAHSIRELLDRLLAASGLAVAVETDPERLRPVDVPLLLGRADRLRGLGWAPRRGLDRAVEELWQEASREAEGAA